MENDGTPAAAAALKQKHHKKKRLETTALGLTILLLAAVGLCVIIGVAVKSSYSYVKDYFGPPETPQFFENFISPVVMQDPKPFSDVKKLDSNWLLKTAIWATLNEDGNSGKYAYTDDNREILPTEDISKEFEKLFGDGIKPVFHTFTDNNATYEYKQKDKCFYIPMIALDDIYSPKVKSIIRNYNTIKLTVDYIPGSGWGQNPDGTASAPAATKTMIYVLKGGRGKYAILSVINGKTASASSYASSVISAASGASSAASISGSQAGVSQGLSSASPAAASGVSQASSAVSNSGVE